MKTGRIDLVAARRPFVDGRFVEGEGRLGVENPATEETFAEVATASPRHFEEAILAARRAQDSGVWAKRPARERAAVVHRMLDYLDAEAPRLVETIVREAGCPRGMTESTQVGAALRQARQIPELFLRLPEEEPNPVPLAELVGTGAVSSSVMRYEPVGVVSAITPYNFPLVVGVWKVFPALMAGCSVVLRPNPLTPIATLAFAEAALAAELPPGVLNVLVEEGAVGGELMTTHPAVDAVSFTGSTAVGRRIMKQAADTVKRLVLELGGKSVQLYLPDAVERAFNGGFAVFLAHAGQACVAQTRMLVPEKRKREVVAEIVQRSRGLPLGDPADPGNLIGPLISAAQRERCERYVRLAVEAGAEVACGGKRPGSLDRGYFFEPTVLDVRDNSNPAAQDEIFGPVLCVLGYEDLDHAVEIANDSIFGLSAGVYGEPSRAVEIASRIRTGTVNVNTNVFSAYASSGGHRQSGLGRERGIDGLRAYQEKKHLAVGAG